MARGLIAEVSWHPRHVEKKTGGDFGLLLVRPKIESQFGTITIRDGEATALLAQAKRKLYGEPCGSLTDNQENVLADRLDYTSLVLYKFKDMNNRTLDHFRWRHCRAATIARVVRWLSKAEFAPRHTMTTAEVLRQLEREAIGTTDGAIIDSIVSPADTRTLRIEIKWREGTRPLTYTHVLLKPKVQLQTHAQR